MRVWYVCLTYSYQSILIHTYIPLRSVSVSHIVDQSLHPRKIDRSITLDSLSRDISHGLDDVSFSLSSVLARFPSLSPLLIRSLFRLLLQFHSMNPADPSPSPITLSHLDKFDFLICFFRACNLPVSPSLLPCSPLYYSQSYVPPLSAFCPIPLRFLFLLLFQVHSTNSIGSSSAQLVIEPPAPVPFGGWDGKVSEVR